MVATGAVWHWVRSGGGMQEGWNEAFLSLGPPQNTTPRQKDGLEKNKEQPLANEYMCLG